MLKIQQFELARTLERSFEIPENVVDLCRCRDFKNFLKERKMVTFTFAITTRSDKLLETALATSIGLVSQLVPRRSDPSCNVIVIASLGCTTKASTRQHCSFFFQRHTLTSCKLVILGAQSLKQSDPLIDVFRWWLELSHMGTTVPLASMIVIVHRVAGNTYLERVLRRSALSLVLLLLWLLLSFPWVWMWTVWEYGWL